MKKVLLFILLATMLTGSAAHAARQAVIRPGESFPALNTEYEFTPGELAYFGIEQGFFSLFSKNSFAVSDISSEIIVVEFFNAYCTSCQAQAPVLNQVFKAVQQNPELRNKIRFIGIGAGNNALEVEKFKQRHEIAFPLIPDQRFSFYSAIGEPGGTPFMLILKRQAEQLIVVGVHSGLIKETSFFINNLKTAAEKNITDLNSRVLEQDITADDTRKLSLNLSPKKQLELVQKSMADACTADCGLDSDITQVRLSSGQELYSAQASLAGKKIMLYSRIFSQKPVCDVCHGIHYIITFDSKGYVRDFLPIHITKYGNVDWNDYDIENMRKQLIGKRLNKELIFDPTLDAVSSATMSSALVYKGVNELQPAYKELK